MSTNFNKSLLHKIMNATCAALSVAALAAAAIAPHSATLASSHREAPLISQDQYADNTDTYVFIPPRSPKNVVLAASWIPFEGPEGGPNYFEWGNGVLYDIYVDNDGDAKADIWYTLSSRVEVLDPTTYQYNMGSIWMPSDTSWNRRQYITVKEHREDGSEVTLVNDKLTAPVNIGSKSTPNYSALEAAAQFTKKVGSDTIKVFGGQTDDAFWVDLQVFDELTLRGQQPPLGYARGNNSPVDSVSGFNVHSLVIEVPIKRLTQGNEPVLGVWATSRRQSMRVLNGAGGLGSLTNSGDYVQVSRLGTPLTNEVVLPYALKDAYNSIDPSVDAVLYTGGAGADIQRLLQKSVEDPEVGRLLCKKYKIPLPGDANKNCSTEVQFVSDVGASGVRSGRGDIFDIFLTGIKLANPFTIVTKNGPVTLPAGFNVTQPANVVPADMLRINTNIKGDLCSPTPSRLGVLGGDACGFPNGRRLTDDMVEIEILAVAGAAYQALDGRDASFSFNPALIGVLTDGVDANDVKFRPVFPYMARAQSGQEHIHQNPGSAVNAADANGIAADGSDAAQRAAEEEAAMNDAANAVDESEQSNDANATHQLFLPDVQN